MQLTNLEYHESSSWYYFEHFAPDRPLFIVSDLHGCAQSLKQLLKFKPPHSLLISLGDALDAGPDSVGVVRLLLAEHSLSLWGNHEALCRAVLFAAEHKISNELMLNWQCNGGLATLKSLKSAPFGLKLFWQYYNELKTHLLCGSILLCHAGIPQNCTSEYFSLKTILKEPLNTKSFVWRRQLPAASAHRFDGQEVLVIAGHTPVKREEIISPFDLRLDLGDEYKAALELEPYAQGLRCRVHCIRAPEFGTKAVHTLAQ
ncbi:MAG: metallophosphoesterase [Succinivibrio sp.]|nr:metallophosphoesterase [Succinivibrio sp.]